MARTSFTKELGTCGTTHNIPRIILVWRAFMGVHYFLVYIFVFCFLKVCLYFLTKNGLSQLQKLRKSYLLLVRWLPPTDALDMEVFNKTVEMIYQKWDLNSCWGWDFPLLAMTVCVLFYFSVLLTLFSYLDYFRF
jgi:hypothetical protein